MRRSRRPFALVASIALLLGTASVASAAPKAGCPAPQSDWRLVTPADAAAEFHPFLNAPITEAQFAALIAANDDRDGDGFVCIRRSWGVELNPNAHWYGTHVLSVRDNGAAANLEQD